MVNYLITTLAHLFHSSIMHFLSDFETVVHNHEGVFPMCFSILMDRVID